MPFVDLNCHLMTKKYNFYIKCQCNSESYDRHIYFLAKFNCGLHFFLFRLRCFFTTRESVLVLTSWTLSYVNISSFHCLFLVPFFKKPRALFVAGYAFILITLCKYMAWHTTYDFFLLLHGRRQVAESWGLKNYIFKSFHNIEVHFILSFSLNQPLSLFCL